MHSAPGTQVCRECMDGSSALSCAGLMSSSQELPECSNLPFAELLWSIMKVPFIMYFLLLMTLIIIR